MTQKTLIIPMRRYNQVWILAEYLNKTAQQEPFSDESECICLMQGNLLSERRTKMNNEGIGLK